MPNPVKLKDVVDALEEVGDEISHYLDKRTGEVVLITDEVMSAAEEDDPLSEYPEWQQEMIVQAREILSSDHFVALPNKFDINEWEIMREFCLSLENRDRGEELLSLIRGSGAFGRFKNAIFDYRIENDWYRFKQAELEKIALEWLDDQGIAFTRDDDELEASGEPM